MSRATTFKPIDLPPPPCLISSDGTVKVFGEVINFDKATALLIMLAVSQDSEYINSVALELASIAGYKEQS